MRVADAPATTRSVTDDPTLTVIEPVASGRCPRVALPVTRLQANLAAAAVILADTTRVMGAGPSETGRWAYNISGEQTVTRFPIDRFFRSSAIWWCLHGGAHGVTPAHARLIASRTVLVDARYPAMRWSAALSSVPYFVVRTPSGWLIWAIAPGS